MMRLPPLKDPGALLVTLAILYEIRAAIGDDGDIPLADLPRVIRSEYERLDAFERAHDSLVIDLLKLREGER